MNSAPPGDSDDATKTRCCGDENHFLGPKNLGGFPLRDFGGFRIPKEPPGSKRGSDNARNV